MVERNRREIIHPVHAVLLASTIPLFLGTLLSDWAYSATYEVQWTNFASWLNAGGLVFAGLALLWAIVDSLRADRGGRRNWIFLGLLLATFVVGLVNALVHARDGWDAMPLGFILSGVVLLLALAATWFGFSNRRAGVER